MDLSICLSDGFGGTTGGGRHFADNYARAVSSFVDNTIAVTKLVNNAMFANLEAFKRTVQTARDNVKEFSRIGVNSARTF
jgi:hypothetical protein